MCKLPYPIAAIATVRRPSKEPSLRAVIPPEARRPPPRVAELARVGVARVAAVNGGAVLRDRGAGAQDRREDRERRPVHGQDAHVRHRPQVVEGAPALVDDDVALVLSLARERRSGEAVKRESAFSQVPFSSTPPAQIAAD